jgi:hypothetical protein
MRRLRRLRGDERGSYLIEFAAISLPLSVMLMSGIELGYLAYAKSHTEGALREASRLAATGSYTEAQIDTFVKDRLKSIQHASVAIEKRSYKSFESVKQPEPLVSDVAPLGGVPSAGDCYSDVNDNGVWDEDMGDEGLGGSEDIVYYGVTVTYPVLFPLTAKLVTKSGNNMVIEANAVIKNEPYGNFDAPTPTTRCI